MRDLNFSDETLGAFVDGELDAASAADVETHLQNDPATRARIDAIRRVTLLVRDVLQTPSENDALAPPPAAEPEARASVSRLVPAPSRPRATGWRMTAPWRVATAFAAGACCTAIALWILGSPAVPLSSWEDHALLFHQTYLEALGSDHQLPLDARSSDPAALDASLAQLVDWQFTVPDLSAQGYRLEGARVIATAEGPLAYVLYSSPKKPLLGLAMLRNSASTAHSGELRQRGKLRLWEWSDGEHQFALGGSHSAASLKALAATIERTTREHAGRPSDI